MVGDIGLENVDIRSRFGKLYELRSCLSVPDEAEDDVRICSAELTNKFELQIRRRGQKRHTFDQYANCGRK